VGYIYSGRTARRWARRVVPALLVGIGAAWLPSGAAASVPGVHALRYKGAPRASSTGNLIDFGGQITPASHTYAIFWGSTSKWPSDVFSGIGNLFTGFNGSNYLGIAQQYMRGSAIGSTYEGAKFDGSSPPRKVSASTLGAEVQKEYGSQLDPAGIYFVYTSNFPNGGGFCAWHSFTSVNGQNVAVAYMPNTTGVAGCDGGNQFGNPAYSEGLYSLANVTAHEFMEAATDTWPGSRTYAWVDSSGSEIGDKCAWLFSGKVTLSNNTIWQLQEEWSNAISGCAQGQ
jgi:hypothetical protein